MTSATVVLVTTLLSSGTIVENGPTFATIAECRVVRDETLAVFGGPGNPDVAAECRPGRPE